MYIRSHPAPPPPKNYQFVYLPNAPLPLLRGPIVGVTSRGVWVALSPPALLAQRLQVLSALGTVHTHTYTQHTQHPHTRVHAHSLTELRPARCPAWWIFCSTRPSWVIWGIIPKVSDPLLSEVSLWFFSGSLGDFSPGSLIWT